MLGYICFHCFTYCRSDDARIIQGWLPPNLSEVSQNSMMLRKGWTQLLKTLRYLILVHC